MIKSFTFFQGAPCLLRCSGTSWLSICTRGCTSSRTSGLWASLKHAIFVMPSCLMQQLPVLRRILAVLQQPVVLVTPVPFSQTPARPAVLTSRHRMRQGGHRLYAVHCAAHGHALGKPHARVPTERRRLRWANGGMLSEQT